MELTTADVTTPRVRWPLVAAAVGVGGLVVAAVVLWARYGIAVFHEIVTAGLALCF